MKTTILKTLKKYFSDADKNKAEQDNQITHIIYDFQKVLECLRSDFGAFFYKRNYNSYNFSIYSTTEKTATCFVCHREFFCPNYYFEMIQFVKVTRLFTQW